MKLKELFILAVASSMVLSHIYELFVPNDFELKETYESQTPPDTSIQRPEPGLGLMGSSSVYASLSDLDGATNALPVNEGDLLFLQECLGVYCSLVKVRIESSGEIGYVVAESVDWKY
jgi:hypothetical protein